MRLVALPNTIDALFITNLFNVRYLTGFSGSSGVCVLTSNKLYFITDGRYSEQSQLECSDCEVLISDGNLFEFLNDIIKKEKIETLGYEAASVTILEYQQYNDKLPNVTLFSTEHYIEQFRYIKTEDEIDKIKSAVKIANESFLNVLNNIKEGISEIEIAAELDYQMKKRGAEKNSFDTICVTGQNSSLIHGKPTNKKVNYGDAILLDFGCIYQGYCSDMTRTVFFGKPNEEQQVVYKTVQTIQAECLAILKADLPCKQAHLYVLKRLKELGFEGYMNHSTGHSLGLELHEDPNLSSRSEDILKENMMITCEPGIYIPQKVGVRIEDLVIIKKDGIVNLTQSITKNMIIL